MRVQAEQKATATVETPGLDVRFVSRKAYEVAVRGHRILVDQPADAGGADSAPLARCTPTTPPPLPPDAAAPGAGDLGPARDTTGPDICPESSPAAGHWAPDAAPARPAGDRRP
jgi:hypothetical protein